MNKAQLITVVAHKTRSSSKEAGAFVEAFLDTVVREVLAGNKVSINGLGVFTPVKRADRTGRNPQTGDSVFIPARNAVKFTPAVALIDMMNGDREVPPTHESAAKKAPKGSLGKLKK